MEFIIVFLVGIAIGLGIAYMLFKDKPIGTLRIENSDPDGPYLFLELETGVADIYTKKHVQLKVNTRSYVSQK